MAKGAGERKRMQTEVANATVSIPAKEGRGVLVGGSMIITAAHCVTFSCTGGMVLGDYYIEEVETARRQKLKVAPLAIEPMRDVAVLGALDNQTFSQEADEFEAWCDGTKPVPLCVADFGFDDSFPVQVYNRDQRWVPATATQLMMEQWLAIKAEAQIESGASGGPIINGRGELVGVVSHFSTANKVSRSAGTTARPHLALPVWVCRRILGQEPVRLLLGLKEKLAASIAKWEAEGEPPLKGNRQGAD